MGREKKEAAGLFQRGPTHQHFCCLNFSLIRALRFFTEYDAYKFFKNATSYIFFSAADFLAYLAELSW
jgi:hypothetical protein